jgi:hypothetical protein
MYNISMPFWLAGQKALECANPETLQKCTNCNNTFTANERVHFGKT